MTSNTSGFTPLDTAILILPDPVEEITQGGIIIASSKVERDMYAQTKATLIAVGANAFSDWGAGVLKPEAGQRVVMAQYAGKMHKGVDGKDYRICRDEDVLALLNDGENNRG